MRKPTNASLWHGTGVEIEMSEWDFIRGIGELQFGDRVVICVRVSRRAQFAKGNLADQERNLRRAAADRGARVVHVISCVGPGWDTAWLVPAFAIARENGAKLFFESVSRLVRSRRYHSIDAPNEEPTDQQFEELRNPSEGVTIISLCDPNSTPAEERGFQSARGQTAKGRKGGRPRHRRPGYMQKRRFKLQPKAQELRANGAPLGQIAKIFAVPRSTVQNWVR